MSDGQYLNDLRAHPAGAKREARAGSPPALSQWTRGLGIAVALCIRWDEGGARLRGMSGHTARPSKIMWPLLLWGLRFEVHLPDYSDARMSFRDGTFRKVSPALRLSKETFVTLKRHFAI